MAFGNSWEFRTDHEQPFRNRLGGELQTSQRIGIRERCCMLPDALQ
jgi:hypothetical protein